MVSDYETNAGVFKAFCDEKRLRILDILQSGETCVCTLYENLGLPQSTLSYHMKILCEAGVVKGRQAGKWTHYSISSQGMARAAEILKSFTLHKAKPQKDRECSVSI